MNATRTLSVVGVVLAVVTCFVPGSNAQTLPAPPQTFVDTSYPASIGMMINVAAGGDLQGALDSAQPGDTILLQAGATFSGSFTLPAKSGSGWIIVRTSAPDSSLPPGGTRITPAYAGVLPKIVASSSAAALQTDPGAHHYRFTGIEFTVASGLTINYGVVQLGDDSISQAPYSLVFDRVYVHGLSGQDVRRGFALNCGSAAIINSYISEIHEVGADSQAIAGWNGPGPFKIANNYLEAAGENILFGGSDPSITNLVPSDIEVRGNYFFKPASWLTASWTVKNILELKNAQRVLVDGNIFEHNWPAAQNGFSILFTVRNQDGSAPWSVVQDVTFTHNIVRHVAAAVNILGTDDLNPSQQTKRILIKDNLFDDVSAVNWGGNGRLFQILDGTADITIDHNTGFHTGEVIAASGAANALFFYRNNLSPNNQYGVAGDNFYGDPLGTLSTYFPAAVFVKNILQGGDPLKYPPVNFFPATMNDVGFVNFASGDYRLSATSPYKNAATDGKDIGADIGALNAATAHAMSGVGPLVRGDFNADGKSDVIWRKSTTGENAIWLMNGVTIASPALPPKVSDTNWKMAGVGDFNGDGKADVIWLHHLTGQVVIWLMNGTSLSSATSVVTLADTNWKIAGVGDFNNDGKSDVVWRNQVTGQMAVWLMNGTTIATPAVVGTVSDLNYTIVGIGDFDGDGKADLFWRHGVTGSNVIWFMNGASLSAAAVTNTVANVNYKVVGVGDTDADGKADVMWWNQATGDVVLWIMNGAAATGGFITTVADLNWHLEAVGDFDGDGKADLIWRKINTGEVVVWLMNGSTIKQGAFVTTVNDLNWSIVAPR